MSPSPAFREAHWFETYLGQWQEKSSCSSSFQERGGRRRELNPTWTYHALDIVNYDISLPLGRLWYLTAHGSWGTFPLMSNWSGCVLAAIVIIVVVIYNMQWRWMQVKFTVLKFKPQNVQLFSIMSKWKYFTFLHNFFKLSLF